MTDGLSYNGQAAISVAQSFGFRVYVTVNNEEEIPTVLKLFPTLSKDDIVSHEDNDFDVPLGIFTNGTYFDIIMNNVEKEKLTPAIKCLGTYGILFHFGKEDLKKNVKMGKTMIYFQFWINLLTICFFKRDKPIFDTCRILRHFAGLINSTDDGRKRGNSQIRNIRD